MIVAAMTSRAVFFLFLAGKCEQNRNYTNKHGGIIYMIPEKRTDRIIDVGKPESIKSMPADRDHCCRYHGNKK